MSAEVKNDLIASLRSQLEDKSTRFDEKRCRFLTNVDGVRNSFQVIFNETPRGFRVYPSVGVRFDVVEQLFHRTSGIPKANWDDSTTVGMDMRLLAAETGGAYEFELIGPTDVAQVSRELTRIYSDDAKRFFEQYSTLESIDAALNSNPTAKSPLRVLPWYRCSTGLIVASLVNRPNIQTLIEVYTDMLKNQANGFYLPRFQALVADLRK